MLYAVSVIVTRRFPDGWTSAIDMPTFYLDSNVQGIVSADHAAEIARQMFMRLGHKRDDVSVYAVPTIAPIAN